MNIKKHIPNLFTLANLVCGISAIICFLNYLTVISVSTNNPLGTWGVNNADIWQSNQYTFFSSLHFGIGLILLATVFDFLDGFMAKILNAKSKIGAQLDSLSDMVTFGVAPGILLYVIAENFLVQNETVHQAYFILPIPENIDSHSTTPLFMYWHFAIAMKYLSFLIPIFSALRLAKFNIDTEQTTYFKGIPTPANAIFWCGLIYAMTLGTDINPIIICLLLIIMSLLMMSNIKMLSFKMKNLAFKGDNIYRYALITGAPILGVVCYLLGNIFLAIPLIIILYILLSIPYHIYYKNETT